ncbi:hypothetical protein C6P61_08145 [Malikia spinosa]|uniref:Uncharacterized protein n=1 Tax=Malikia spinosa TaxID=86180 RepID=A0A2S9KF08_9BURK|nr:hypothetical protein [Malikia spinosa]PRD69040.1 hypothetical protein C6P61_08145 [Malikia spinosa]
MGEWSEYFEDFPEEDPGNYDEQGRFDPNRRQRDEAERQRQLDAALRRQLSVPRVKPQPQ